METKTEKAVRPSRTLPLTFVRAGLLWEQVERTDKKAIYQGSIMTGGLSGKTGSIDHPSPK